MRCTHNVDCAPGLVCDWSNTPYVCAPPKLGGESCAVSSDCVAGMYCRIYLGQQLGTCDCVSCPNDTLCNNGQRCITATLNTAGATICETPFPSGANCSVFARQCADGLTCIEGYCSTPKPLGSLCSLSDECQSAAHCDPQTNRCATDLAEGQPCRIGGLWNSSCQDGLYCDVSCALTGPDEGTCRRWLAEGESCQGCLRDECGQGLACAETPDRPGRTCQGP